MNRKKGKRLLFGVAVLVIVLVCSCTKRQEYQNEDGKAQVKEISEEKAENSGKTVKHKSDKEIQELLKRDKYRKELVELLKTDSRILQIVENRNKYPDKLIETLIKYPETIEFVLDYPKYRGKDQKPEITEDYKDGTIPLFIQWDKRWGYHSYGGSLMGITGCGPSCLSMVLAGLTGDTDMNPAEVADYSEENGYWVEGAGTSWELMNRGAEELGLSVKRLILDEDEIYRELMLHHPVICSMKPGDFTYTGHFIVLTGIDQNGKVLLNDPNSQVRSAKSWEMARICRQMKSAWSYSINS